MRRVVRELHQGTTWTLLGVDLFITRLFGSPLDRFHFFAWVLVVVASIVLHELAHGWAAMRLGDRTPVLQGRMTGNPMVHMGPISIVALLVAGLAWGQMPIDPTRLRGRWGEAYVALAGPAMNLLLAVVSLGALVLLWRWGVFDASLIRDDADEAGLGSDWRLNLWLFLRIGGMANLTLCVFNLLPAPPLDGSHVASTLSPGYARFITEPGNHGIVVLMFLMVWVVSSVLIQPVIEAADWLVLLLVSL